MPPDFDELPIPKSEDVNENQGKNSIQKLITDDDNTPSQTTKSESSEKNFEKLLIEKINKN